MRQALDIFEKSLIPDHQNIASALNNLARLLEDTNRLAEAEPLMRRNIAILFKSSRRTGYVHPNLQAAFFNYVELLKAMGRSEARGRGGAGSDGRIETQRALRSRREDR